MMPLRAILPYLLQQPRYFKQAGREPKIDIFKAVLVPTEEVAIQIDDQSCGVFCLAFLDNIIRGLPIFDRITQSVVNKLKCDYAFQIFLNSTNPAEASEQFSFGSCSNHKYVCSKTVKGFIVYE